MWNVEYGMWNVEYNIMYKQEDSELMSNASLDYVKVRGPNENGNTLNYNINTFIYIDNKSKIN
jgi:hypothetical protein